MLSHGLWLVLAGATGTVARVLLASWVQQQTATGLPYGTASVNLLGCFLFGVVFAFAERFAQADTLRFVLLAGFMGAFTTFSSYMFDTLRLLQDGRVTAALLNLLLQNSLGLLGVFFGLHFGRAVV
jgi:CrcB protein